MASAPSLSQTMISSKLKTTYPPTVYGGMSVDIMNMNALFKIFNEVKSHKDDAMAEKVTHTIQVMGRLHNAACEQVLLPLVKQLSKGGTMAQEMSALVREKEELGVKIYNTKKHLANKEFVNLMQQMESAFKKGAEMTQKAIDAMAEEVDEDTMVDAAERMESVKMSANIMPHQMMYS